MTEERLKEIEELAFEGEFASDFNIDHVNELIAEVRRLQQANIDLSIDCPNCGSCGEVGCCEASRCRYLKSHQGTYDALAKEKDALRALLREARIEIGWGEEGLAIESLIKRIDAALSSNELKEKE